MRPAFWWAALTVALATSSAEANGVLQQIAVGLHDSSGNNLHQIGLALHDADGTYVAGDGSVRTIPNDGSVRFISVGQGSSAALCFHNVNVPGSITDGTSNTIVLTESVALHVTPGSVSGLAPIRTVLDGSSNTIFLPEGGPTSLCLGNTFLDDSDFGNIGDGTSNTIQFGETSSFDVCFPSANVASIPDGTSNTLLFGETRNSVCYTDIQVASDLTVSGVPEPAIVSILGLALAGLGAMGRRRAA